MWLWNLQSSNAFASGANQNSGNFITGRPSTRVNAHGQSSGGGASQWSIGGFTDAPADAPQSSNAFASGSNQNSGNVLTDRASTRVVREPGGASQWSVGGFPQEPSVMEIAKKSESPTNSSNTLADFVASSTSSDYGQHIYGASSSNESSNAFANGANQNDGNTITGRPSTKVRQAPGGTSSIVFG